MLIYVNALDLVLLSGTSSIEKLISLLKASKCEGPRTYEFRGGCRKVSICPFCTTALARISVPASLVAKVVLQISHQREACGR